MDLPCRVKYNAVMMHDTFFFSRLWIAAHCGRSDEWPEFAKLIRPAMSGTARVLAGPATHLSTDAKGRFPLPEFTARVDGCQKMHPSSRAVNSARELGP